MDPQVVPGRRVRRFEKARAGGRVFMRRCSVQCIDEIFNGLRPQGFDFRSEAVYCAERMDMKRASPSKEKDALKSQLSSPSVR
ncbi:hypothetical protein GCM10007872_01030 [Gluconobacter sphaericus NBRC 12467]|uniref:Uncharacterized protein n=1 Tax=Gluconobacter sphaericus NBRC 12467 TaxID=1307951 RepID=A0AA37W8E6_9PROT|nr:hypothetical protein GSP01_16920 [Gluconobacter sphaericus NBRC 12467]GLQ83195.1 hypothetical protein GCM10007872_01030 [Gluconobacter sphaericus NBRC 12467]